MKRLFVFRSMAKSNAGIQKSYREKKRIKRVKNTSKKTDKGVWPITSPVVSWVGEKRQNENRLNRKREHKYWQKKTEEARTVADTVLPPGEASGYESGPVPSAWSELLIVRMNFPSNRRSGARKRISEALFSAHRRIRHVEEKAVGEIQNCSETKHRRKKQQIPDSPSTARSQARIHSHSAGPLRKQGDRIRPQLVLGNALLSQIRCVNDETGQEIRTVDILKSIICGKIIGKYFGLQWLSSKTAIGETE